jgi:hypothetical protein
MSMGMILLTVLVILLLAIVALPFVGGGIIGSIVLMRDTLRKIRYTRKISARMEREYSQRVYPSILK